GLVLAILLLAAAWLYRDRIVSEVGRRAGSSPPAATGQPADVALRSARGKIAALARGAGDSVVLDAPEAASLVVAGLDPAVRGRLDSLTVQLGRGRIALSGLIEIGKLPADAVGPMTIVLRDRERVTIGGPLALTRPERAEWAIDELAVRGVPLPRDFVERAV